VVFSGRRAYIHLVMFFPHITLVPPQTEPEAPAVPPVSGVSLCLVVEPKKKPAPPGPGFPP
jgi:hypothetical protein